MAKQKNPREPNPDAQKRKKPSVEERQKARAKEARRDNWRKTLRRIAMFAIFFVAFLGINAWFARDTGEGPLGAQYDEVRTYPVACGAQAPPAPETLLQFAAPVDQGFDPESTVTAVISTSCGDLTLDLDTRTSPEAVNSFVFLANAGFYDGTAVHRILPGVLIEAGDPLATGDGSGGYRLPDEPPPSGFAIGRGTVILSPGDGPNRSGSQFKIALDDDPPFNRSASILGTITEGESVLDRISAIPVGIVVTSDRSYPLEAVYIESIEITVGE